MSRPNLGLSIEHAASLWPFPLQLPTCHSITSY